MSDSIFQDLFKSYSTSKHNHTLVNDLLIADENIGEDELSLVKTYHLSVLTNRKDIAQKCHMLSIEHYFSDFNFEQIDKQFDCVVYRVSKERPICHYIFNQLKSRLTDKGTLIIAGKKNEGIKSYYQKLVNDLKFTGKLKKHKDRYIAVLTKHSLHETLQGLDDKDYRNLTKVEIAKVLTSEESFESEAVSSFYSKPGVYGWNKIDKGSQLLFDTFIADIRHSNITPTKVLDLGCGYGFLSIKVLKAMHNNALSTLTRLVATDNNAAAITCCQKNLQELSTQRDVSLLIRADDCGENLQESFDIVLSNPPFHQGFDHAKSLTNKFLSNGAKLLNKTGAAYFVVNAFIGIEKQAEKYFGNISVLKNTGQFKIVKLSK